MPDATPQAKIESTEQKQVSYEEFSKLKTDFESRSTELAKLKEENTKLRDTLLSPDYLEKLTGGEPETKKPAATDAVDFENMSKRELVEFAVRAVAEHIAPEINKRFTSLEQSIQLSEAKKELAETKKRFPDFDQFQDKIRTKIEANDKLTYRDAYLLVRQEERLEKDEEAKRAEAKASTEKPGGISRSATVAAEFKSKEEANNDAWERTVGKKDRI